MLRGACLLVFALALTACGGRSDEDIATYALGACRLEARTYGFAEGSPAFNQCYANSFNSLKYPYANTEYGGANRYNWIGPVVGGLAQAAVVNEQNRRQEELRQAQLDFYRNAGRQQPFNCTATNFGYTTNVSCW